MVPVEQRSDARAAATRHKRSATEITGPEHACPELADAEFADAKFADAKFAVEWKEATVSADRLTLLGVRAIGHHGVFEHERAEGQEFVIDVDVETDFKTAIASDDVEDTLHYGILAERIVAAVERDPVDLIETLAERIAALVLEFPTASEVKVCVHKPNAPITVPFQDVSVSITRSRT